MPRSAKHGCKAFQDSLRADRRSFLKVGMLGAAGLTLSQLMRLEAQSADSTPSKRPTSVIILYMRGGPSQLETWDMKPDAPKEVAGEFKPIATSVPGINICELLPMSARCNKHWSIVRSLHHRPQDGNPDHSNGDQICFTGYPPGRSAEINVHPSVGAVSARQLQHLNPTMPAYVMVPRMIPGTDSSYLGKGYRPFETMADPASKGKFVVPNLQLASGLSVEQMQGRRELLQNFDTMRRDIDASGSVAGLDSYQRKAWDIILGDEAREAFDLDAEPEHVRKRYGFFEQFKSRMRAGGDAPGWSQRVLLARRLVEAGVRLVTVDLRWWDTHDDNFWSLKNGFLPRFDQCYSALIEDLAERGLLDSTLVVAWGEHGRTPKVNNTAGRDHWGKVFSAALAGGGVHGGRVVGSSDSKAAFPKDNPKIPHDVLATIYRHLNVDTTVNYLDHSGRPHPVLPDGKPIDELF